MIGARPGGHRVGDQLRVVRVAGQVPRQRTPEGQAFVVSEANGVWRGAEEVPGTAALNTNGTVPVNSASCASAGN